MDICWTSLFLHSDGPLFAFSLFTPSIINELGKYRHFQSFPTSDVCIGFTATKANLLSVPVYAWGCLMTVVIGVYADRLNKRCLVNVYAFSLSIYFFSVHDYPGVCSVSDWLDTSSLSVQGRQHYRILLFTLPFRESDTWLWPSPTLNVCDCRAIYPTIRRLFSGSFFYIRTYTLYV